MMVGCIFDDWHFDDSDSTMIHDIAHLLSQTMSYDFVHWYFNEVLLRAFSPISLVNSIKVPIKAAVCDSERLVEGNRLIVVEVY